MAASPPALRGYISLAPAERQVPLRRISGLAPTVFADLRLAFGILRIGQLMLFSRRELALDKLVGEDGAATAASMLAGRGCQLWPDAKLDAFARGRWATLSCTFSRRRLEVPRQFLDEVPLVMLATTLVEERLAAQLHYKLMIDRSSVADLRELFSRLRWTPTDLERDDAWDPRTQTPAERVRDIFNAMLARVGLAPLPAS